MGWRNATWAGYSGRQDIVRHRKASDAPVVARDQEAPTEIYKEPRATVVIA
jgi:hypothetical protein